MRISYSGRSKPSALKIAEASGGTIEAVRSGEASINWGRAQANTRLNPDISNTTNKRVMRQLFEQHDVPMPQLYSIEDDWSGRPPLAFPCIGRPDSHTKGRGLWKCNNVQDVIKALRGTRKKKAATHFMEYIEADREYRVHIFQGKSIRISEKGFLDDSKKEYITRKPDRPVRQVREAAKRAVEAVGLDFGAVDILARGDDNSEVWVLEVNAAPGLGGSMPALYSKTLWQWYEEEVRKENA